MNTARSAISSITSVNSVNTIGDHPLVKRYMRGVFTKRPSLPKYSASWDVGVVLRFLKTLMPVNKLSLKQLTWKLVMLLALLTGQRGQTLHLMDLRYIDIQENTVHIQLLDLLKTSKPGKHLKPITLERYYSDSSLCVVDTFKTYIDQTKVIRGKETKLFNPTVRPFKAISRQTLSTWVQKILCISGIDIKKFAPHSTRSASVTTATKCGIPFDVFLKMANWSSESTFYKFYFKPDNSQRNFN